MNDTGRAGFVWNRGAEAHAGSDVQSISGGLLLSRANVPGIENCLGAIIMSAGVVSPEAVKHETSEVMYVAAGCGELHTEAGTIPLSKGDAVFIPAAAWHWLANTGTDDLVSVFCFPGPDRPASQSGPVTAQTATFPVGERSYEGLREVSGLSNEQVAPPADGRPPVSERDVTRLGGIGEIAEDEATGAIALAYEQIRTALGVSFVPTIYRMLATHQNVLVMAVEQLAPLLHTQLASNFGHEMRRVARHALQSPSASGSWVAPDQQSLHLIDRYSGANPLGLLFVLGLLGTHVVQRPSVMSPPLPNRSDDIWSDILICHGGVTTPGFWREFGRRPGPLEVAWSATRAHAERGGFDASRKAVLDLGAATVRDAGIDRLLNRVDPVEAKEIHDLLSWFPTGIATMIAETEWLKFRS